MGITDEDRLVRQFGDAFGKGSGLSSCIQVEPRRDDLSVYRCDVVGLTAKQRRRWQFLSTSQPPQPLQMCFVVIHALDEETAGPLSYAGEERRLPCGTFKGWQFAKHD
jgi:hypothetical protein